ncbi:hypothetical protein [Legionella cincinnatiensis]|uniref:hypothetical protein n=1 Tax=Legionella cincinnatiensis TaxID=28085 RepID=UPI0010413E70|nr:hypothetical protein [Legionella cincinnatiensis]
MSTCCDLIIQVDTMDENVTVYFTRINALLHVKKILRLEIQRYNPMTYMTDQYQPFTIKTT